jgi:hypothetical protein
LVWACSFTQVLDCLLQPHLLAERGERLLKREVINRLWPAEVAVPKFIDFLKGQYDYTQLFAIEVRCCNHFHRAAILRCSCMYLYEYSLHDTL